jgi:hypothetical protein
MFPKDSRLHRIVANSDGDGFKALKNILYCSHPAFHDQPSTLITSYPRQRDLDLLQYAQLMRDFQQLCAYISNHTASLDDSTEVDIFINNLRHSEFINRVTRNQRRLYSNSHKYTVAQLIETIMTKLMAPDSPARSESAKGGVPKFLFNKNNPNRRPLAPPAPTISHARVHPVQAASDHLDSVSIAAATHPIPTPLYSLGAPLEPDEPPPTPTYHTLADSLRSIATPITDDDMELYHRYCATVHRINADPNQANIQSCLVCHGQHRFDACPILAKYHYIRYCQQLKRDTAARTSAFPTQALRNPSPPIHTLNFVDHVTLQGSPDSDHESDFDPNEDVQLGRA